MGRKKISFIWDGANVTKIWIKHHVRSYGVEEAFRDKNAIIGKDTQHSEQEDRYILLGKTQKNHLLYIVFTVRGGRIRPISARTANRKEVVLYEEKINSTKV